MNFVWALFFIGAGDIQPIDTGYHFESSADCMNYKSLISVKRYDYDGLWTDDSFERDWGWTFSDFYSKAPENSQKLVK